MSDYTNHGILFRNGRKQPGTKQPDWRGKLNVAGVEYELGGWVREGRNGKFISLSVKPADGADQRQPERDGEERF